ncbi:MAG: glycosyltransferase [Eubacteriales bacterium]|nr:glycosyltransferase [Eubacteriales bacterium]
MTENRKKKVCIIVSVLKDGGAQRAAGNISMALEEDCEVSFVTFSADNAAYPHGGTLYDLRLPRKKGLLAATLNEWKRTRALGALKKKLQPDICISFLDDANLPNVLTKGKCKTIVSLRTHLSSRPMGRLARAKARFAYSRADGVVSVSKAAMEDLIRLGYAKRENCRAIGNMVDGGALLERAGQQPKRAGEGPLVATMGSLVAQKGMWNLLRAFRLVLHEHPTAQLMLLGGGKTELYRKLARELGIENSVTFQGFVKNPHGLLKQADLFVFPSRFEGMPNALLEAMSLGLPVVSTDCPSGPREILAPDTPIDKTAAEIEYAPYGVLLPVPQGGFLEAGEEYTKEEELMAQTICRMLSDDALRRSYAEKAAQRAADFSPEAIKREWLALIEQ